MKRLVIVLFFLSGACGLVYEVVWTRVMTHVFGATGLAVGTVLAAFIAGLAVGGWSLGRVADRVRNPLRLYAGLEAGVAVAAAVAHFLLTHVTPAYVAAHGLFGGATVALAVARFVMAFALVLAPTLLMGATLPVLTRFVARRIGSLGSDLGALYAINTAGAVAGALAAGFWLIGTFGVDATAAAAVAGNLVIGIVAWVVSSGAGDAAAVGSREAETAPADRHPAMRAVAPRAYRLVLAGLAACGMASFAYEVYWSRALIFIVGNSTYAVTTTLVAFLTGIALGGYLIGFVLRRVADGVAVFGWIQVLIAVTAALAMPALSGVLDPEAIRERLWASADHVFLLILYRFAIAFFVMFLPALLIGATFPLVGALGVRDLGRSGASVGRIYAINTAGNVLGALLPGLVLLHWLGIQHGILLMAALNLVVGLVVLLSRAREVPRLRWVLPAVLAAAVLAPFVAPLEFSLPSVSQGSWDRVLYHRDGPSATTTVLLNQDTGEKSMMLDGIDIGGTGPPDYKQQILAHLPKLLLDHVSDELSVGLGSGILAGESIRHDRVASITCVEIEPTVLEGARWFAGENHDVLSNPAVTVVIDDVANFLRTTPHAYDVVSADEKTAQEYASNGFSYSLDYYTLIRRRLNPRGMVAQWVPTSLPPAQYRMVLRTFCEAFPHVLVWYVGPALMSGESNTVLVGSNDRIEPDLERARRWMAAEADAFEGLSRYGRMTPEVILAQLCTTREVLYPALADAPVNTLAHPRYEFYSPYDYAVPPAKRLAENFAFLMQLRRRTPESARPLAAGVSHGDSLLRAIRAAEDEYLTGCGMLLAEAPPNEAVAHLERAIAITPWNEHLRARVFSQYWVLANQFAAAGEAQAAAQARFLGLRAYGRDAMSHVEYGQSLESAGDGAGALMSVRRAVAMDPDLVAARRVLAHLLIAAGRGREAREHLRAILQRVPDDIEARRLLAAPERVSPQGPLR